MEMGYSHWHLTGLKQQNGLSVLKELQVMGCVRISRIDHSCSKEWANEKAAGNVKEVAAVNAFVYSIDALAVVESEAHDNAQAAAGSGAADSAWVAVENEAADNAYEAAESGIAGNIQLAEVVDLAEESAMGHAEEQLDAEGEGAEAASLHALVLVQARARALVQAPALVIPLERLLERMVSMMIYYHGLSRPTATSPALLMRAGK